MFEEDIAAFFDLGDFAVQGELAGLPVVGIFDNEHARADVGVGFASSAPIFTMPTSAVPVLVDGAVLTVSGASYVVVEHRPDGTGISTLVLERMP